MAAVAPYLEAEQFPRGKRVLLALPACILLIGPYGAMLGDGPSNPLAWVGTLLAVAAGAVLIGLAIAQPRRRVTVDGDARTIVVAQTAPLPRIGQERAERAFDEVAGTTVEAVAPSSGGGSRGFFQPVIELTGGGRIILRAQPTPEHAQDVIDHLVHLGLPGRSRSAQLDSQTAAPPPTTWL